MDDNKVFSRHFTFSSVMDDADGNVARQSGFSKSGDVRWSGSLSGSGNGAPFDRHSYREPYQPSLDRFYQKPPAIQNFLEPNQPMSYLNPHEQPQHNLQHQLPLRNNFELWRQQGTFGSENDSLFSRMFSRAPETCLPRSDSNPSLIDIFSSPSSPESFRSSRPTSDRQQAPINSVSTQTERSPFEEKFLFRESILLGCDLVADLAQKVPAVAEVKEYADYIREKTIQSRSQNICSGLAAGATEEKIVSEYVKTFIKIADSWLEARNCFGLAERCCSKTCSLDVRDLSANYIDWMNSSRQLLNGIVSGLEKINILYGSDNFLGGVVNPSVIDPAQSTSGPTGPGGLWGYPPNPPCHCAPVPSRSTSLAYAPPMLRSPSYPVQPENWFQSKQMPSYPPGFNSQDNSENNSAYLKPSSYDVPRKNMTTSMKRSNISKAKSDAFQDGVVERGYVVGLTTTWTKSEGDIQEEEEGKIRVAQKQDGLAMAMGMANEEDSESVSDEEGSKFGQQHWNTGKGLRGFHQRPPMSQTQMAHMEALAEALCKFDLPQSTKPKISEFFETYKTPKQPVSVESIYNKVKNNSYETVEQFIHDCRRLFKTLSHQQKNKAAKENVGKMRTEFENLLEQHFDNMPNWKHISSDTTECNYSPELRNSRKKSKPVKQANIATSNCDSAEVKVEKAN